jgi:eukaryotic-like serine/threonine-protein kinase
VVTELRDRLQSSLGGSYTLERELAGPGGARSFVAGAAGDSGSVVVKVLESLPSESIDAAKFVQVIERASGLRHPNLVPLRAAGSLGGVPWFSAQYVEGLSLRDRLLSDGALGVPESVDLLRGLLAGLDHAHERAFVHRDIRPETIVLIGSTGLLLEMGVAQAAVESCANGAAGLIALGAAAGTAEYMAPEQATADPAADHRADIYSLGVVAYEMLAGEHPFGSRAGADMVAAHAMEIPAPLSKHRPGAPSALLALVMQMMAKDPARRPQSAGEILSALERSVTPAGGMPLIGVRVTPAETQARQAAPWYDWAVHWRWRVPRHVAAILAAFVIVIAGGFGVWRASGGAEVRAERFTLAVLPFENVGGQEHAYFTGGLADALTWRLSQTGGITVLGDATLHVSAPEGKTTLDVARELGVTHVLAGSVTWEDTPGGISRLIVRPEIVRLADSRQVWAGEYEAGPADVFSVQSEIAEQIVLNAGVVMPGTDAVRIDRPPTASLQAYDLFLRARAAARGGQPDSLRAALVMFESAAALDSGFALAWTEVASALGRLAGNGLPLVAATGRARSAAQRALELDSSLVAARVLLASIYLLNDRNIPEAREELRTSLAAEPGNASARALRGLRLLMSGSTDSAVTELEMAWQRDPMNHQTIRWYVYALGKAGRPADGVAAATRFAALAGKNDPGAGAVLALAHSGVADYAGIRDAALRAAPTGVQARAWLGYAEARLGNRNAARKIAAELERAGADPVHVALVHAGLGDAASSLKWLARGLSEKSPELGFLWWPAWEPIRGDPEFATLRQRIGIPRTAN